MSKKFFTDKSSSALVNKIKSYVNNVICYKDKYFTKQFKITVNDSGAITATEYTG